MVENYNKNYLLDKGCPAFSKFKSPLVNSTQKFSGVIDIPTPLNIISDPPAKDAAEILEKSSRPKRSAPYNSGLIPTSLAKRF